MEAHEFVVILGPSGCGKSTLLRLAAGLLRPESGFIKTPDWRKHQLGMVFQDPELLPWRTVEQNILLSQELRRRHNTKTPDKRTSTQQSDPSEGESNLLEILDLVQLRSVRTQLPSQLSGGMKMRVSLARALVEPVELLLMDEPFAALDELTRFELQDSLRSIFSRRKMSILFVTHSMSEAVYLADRILILNSQGELKFEKQILGRDQFENQRGMQSKFEWRNSPELHQQLREVTEQFREVNARSQSKVRSP